MAKRTKGGGGKRSSKKKRTSKKSSKKTSGKATKKKKARASGTTKSGARKAREGPSPDDIRAAATRAGDWLSERDDYYGFLSRQRTRRGAPELGSHLRGDLLARQGRDGSWGEDLQATAEAIWQLLDLGAAPDSRAIAQGASWLYGRRGADGAYGEGCTPTRHEQGTCEHYITGMFSPGPSDQSQEATLSNGQTVTSDSGARLLLSERALRTLLRADPRDPRAAPSISGLRGLPLYLEYGGTFTPAVLVGAVQALAWAPTLSGELRAGLESLVTNQEKDGTWPNVEFFFVLEALLEVNHPAAGTMFRKAVPRLLETQHKYGGWGRSHVVPQTLIGLLSLDRVLAESGG